MLSRMRPSLRESSPFLVTALRLVGSAIVACLIYPIAMWHTGTWADHYDTLMLLSAGVSLLVFHAWGLYRSWRDRTFLNEMRTISGAWITVVCMALFLLFAFKVVTTFFRVVLVSWFLITPLCLLVFHGLVRAMLQSLRSRGKNIRSAVIVGACELGPLVADYIRDVPWAGIRVLGFFDDLRTTENLSREGRTGQPALGTVAELPQYLQDHPVDLVYITLPLRMEEEIQGILRSCRTFGAHIYLVPDLYAFQAFNSRIQRFGGLLLLDFNPDSARKRAFDVCFSLAVLLLTLPATVVIALLIKLGDWGPIFYGHPRVTVAGKRFRCLKFRTMHKDADKWLKEILDNDPKAKVEWDRTFKLKNDPRVTWIGRFLRKSSLDELPQFINVLSG